MLLHVHIVRLVRIHSRLKGKYELSWTVCRRYEWNPNEFCFSCKGFLLDCWKTETKGRTCSRLIYIYICKRILVCTTHIFVMWMQICILYMYMCVLTYYDKLASFVHLQCKRPTCRSECAAILGWEMQLDQSSFKPIPSATKKNTMNRNSLTPCFEDGWTSSIKNVAGLASLSWPAFPKPLRRVKW